MHLLTRIKTPIAALAGTWLILSAAAVFLFGSGPQLSAQEPGPDGFQAYRLRHVAADEMASQLRNILADVAGNPEVLVDRRSNRVLVKGPQQAHRLTVETIRAVDLPPPAIPRQLTPPGAAIVRGYPIPPAHREAAAGELRARFGATAGVSISVDNRTGQLLLAAPRETQDQMVALLQTRGYLAPDQQHSGPALRGVTAGPGGGPYRLRHITWRDLEGSFQRIYGQLPVQTANNGQLAMIKLPLVSGVETVMHVDRFRDQVHFEGPGQAARPWEQIVRALDSPRGDASQQTQLIPLHRAHPANVHRAISLVRAAEQNSALGRTSHTLRLGGPDARRGGGELVSMIFQPGAQGGGANQTNQDALDDEGGFIGDVQIQFIPELGIFIVTGNPRDVERVLRIIQDIEDQSALTQPEVEVYPLQHANSAAVAEMVNELYEQVFAPRQGLVTITALEKPNSLLLIGRKEAMQSVIELIKKLDQPVAPTTQIQIFPLRHMSAVDAEEKIAAFYEERTGLDTRVRVMSDYRTNSLIVQASPRDLEEVKRLLESMDVDTAPAISELRIFPLKNSFAEDLATVLQAALSGQADAAAGQQTGAVARARSVILQFIALDDEGNQILESGILSDVQVTGDANANALIVRGPAKSMELIAAVIRALDQLPAAEAKIKVFEIINADASSLQLTLLTLFGQTTTGQGGFGAQGAQQVALPSIGGGDNSLVPLRFAVDLRTNTIIASGSEGDLLVVEAILARLDQADIESRRTTVYRLENAPSDDVANALTDLLTRQTQVQQLGVTQQLVSVFDQIEREVIVVSEPVTNSLLISATPRYFDEIMRVVEELDIRPPMVMIQVLIAEVSFNDTYEFGAEFGVQDALLFDRGLASVGYAFNNQPLGNDLLASARASRNDLAGQGLSHFGLGRTNPTLGYGGLVLSAANESLSVLVRALQDEGRLEILSRPQIMTLDNQPAFIQVGARVPRITNSSTTPQGGTQNTTQDEDVGLLLRVQPRISPDGLVVMLLDTEKSEVGPIAQGIPVAVDAFGNPILSPQINTTTAQTTISARSGQTVVFAGLITESETLATRGVPFLADIPIVGRLFRFESEITERTELLIIMTPYIIEDDEDVEFIKTIESQRMSWSLAAITEVHGNVGLYNRYGDSQYCQPMIIYPDDDPTGGGEIVPTSVETRSQRRQFPEDRSSRRNGDDPPPNRSAMLPHSGRTGQPRHSFSFNGPGETSASSISSPGNRATIQPRGPWEANVAPAGYQQSLPAKTQQQTGFDSYYRQPVGDSKWGRDRQGGAYHQQPSRIQEPYGQPVGYAADAYRPSFGTPAAR